MSVRGAFKITARLKRTGRDHHAEMVIRADAVTVTPDRVIYILGDRQKRRLSSDLWTSVTIENDGGESGFEVIDA